MKSIKQAILFFIIATFLLSNLIHSVTMKKIKEFQDGAHNEEPIPDSNQSNQESSTNESSSSNQSNQESSTNESSSRNQSNQESSTNESSSPTSSVKDTSASLPSSSSQCLNDVIKLDGKCDKEFLNSPFFQNLPVQVSDIKQIIDTLVNQAKIKIPEVPQICFGDYSGTDILKSQQFIDTNCDDLPVKSGSDKWGLINIKSDKIENCGKVEFCVAFDKCGSLAVGISKSMISCISSKIPAENLIRPFLDIAGDFTISTSNSRNLEKTIKIMKFTEENQEFKPSLIDFKVIGHFHVGGGLTLPFIDFRVGQYSLGDIISFNGKLGVMLDYGQQTDSKNIVQFISEISKLKKVQDLTPILREKVKIGNVCFFIDDSKFTLKLESLTNGLIPDITIDDGDAYILVQTLNEPAREIEKGFYLNLTSNSNFDLGALIDKFISGEIQIILNALQIKIPRPQPGESSFSITVTDNSFGIVLVLDKDYSFHCYFAKGNKSGCKINGFGDPKFFSYGKLHLINF